MRVIRIDSDAYLRLATASGHTDYEKRAKAAGIGVATAWRISNGNVSVSANTIAALLDTYARADFNDLFCVDRIQAAA